MSYVCPKCSCGLKNNSETCPECGLVFNTSDWIKEAYSPKNLRARLEFVYSGGSRYRVFETEDFFIGTKPGANGLVLSSLRVKERHARVFRDDDGAWKICGNENEILIDGKRCAPGDCVELTPGMEVGIGVALLRVIIHYELPKENDAHPLNSKKIEAVSLAGKREISIGNDYSCDLPNLSGAAPLHAKIYQRRGRWFLVNCSKAGTLLNGSRIHNAELSEGDCICIAGTRFIFSPKELLPYVPAGFQLDVENVSVARGEKKILEGVSLHVVPGEFVGVLGPSGCGKSSLIQRIVGLDDFDSGKMKINGNAFSECRCAFLEKAAYLPQNVALHEDLTVREEMKIFCRLHGIPSGKIADKLRLVGLGKEADKRTGDLSGGQQRRLGIALELLREPQLLVLDEPTAGLDPKTETEVMTYLRRIASQGKTVICSTHILGNLNLFDKVLLLADGRTVFFGAPGKLNSEFGVKSTYELYGKLSEPEAVKRFAERAAKKTVPACGNVSATPLSSASRHGAFRGFGGYLQRMLCEVLSFRNAKNRVGGFFQSALFIQLIVQPLLVALAIKLSCAYEMTSYEGVKKTLFFCAVSVFWLGINNTVRELVRERVPWRCLERMEQIASGGYLLAKIAWSFLACCVQITLFAAIIYALPAVDVADSGVHEIRFSTGIFIVLLLTAFTGTLLGLAISAFFKRENAAVSLLPIVLIPVLFFSQPIVDKEKGNRIAAALVEAMPCYEPQMLMHKLDERASDENTEPEESLNADVRKMAGKTGLYMLFALCLMIYFQNKRERDWKGR